ncbi:MAG: large conductance mechanosensitive channel protein MscL [Ruminococcaceae bacterium]|nr:large conductance mechanosensitive channel protein MscL [Oscillospiraceae bacterium]
MIFVGCTSPNPKNTGENAMKKFFAEFKKFITRGNVVDMAVGVIVGSSFTAIVNALSNNILKPLINYLLALIFGANSLSEVYTFLQKGYKDVLDEAGNVIGQELDLAQSIYIDWGAFINAIINFFLIALVLFTIVKIINGVRSNQKNWVDGLDDYIPSREERKEMKKRGIKMSDKVAVAAYYAEKAAEIEAEKAAAEEKARQERLANPTTEDLLKDILKILKNSDLGS